MHIMKLLSMRESECIMITVEYHCNITQVFIIIDIAKLLFKTQIIVVLPRCTFDIYQILRNPKH